MCFGFGIDLFSLSLGVHLIIPHLTLTWVKSHLFFYPELRKPAADIAG